MKFLLLIFISLLISSCKNDEKKEFIVSRFNKNIEKYKQNKIVKNSEYEYIEEIDEFDYPKGAVNFIFLKDSSIFYYSEELIDNWCGWRLKKTDLIKRTLSNDRLHQINFDQIKLLLYSKSFEKDMTDLNNNLRKLSFSFENDTVKNYDIYKLLENIDSLGFHSYNVRRTAPFEIEAISHKN
jgi:hypothetical protein